MPSMTTTRKKRTPNRILPIIYMIDNSKSMIDERIGAVNAAMRNTIDVLKEFAEEDDNSEVRVQVAALTFNTDVEWVTNGLEDLDDFIWDNVDASGLTKLGLAIDSLNEKLSDSGIGMLKDQNGYYPPVIILMSDGMPVDNWKSKLEKALENKIFKYAIKIAIAIKTTPDADEVLAQFTGTNESVITVNDMDALKDLIVVLSSLVNSTMSTTGKIDKKDIIRKATAEVKGAEVKKATGTPSDDSDEKAKLRDTFIVDGKFVFDTTTWNN